VLAEDDDDDAATSRVGATSTTAWPVGVASRRSDLPHTGGLDVLALNETWHSGSDDVCLRLATPTGNAVVDVARILLVTAASSSSSASNCNVRYSPLQLAAHWR